MQPSHPYRARTMRPSTRWGAAFVLVALAAAGGWWMGRGGRLSAQQMVRPALDLSDAFVDIAAGATPAVVSIEARMPAGAPRFVGGTGFIVRADGHILTNAHVVSGADRVLVTLHDRSVVSARFVGADPATDLAVIQIEDAGDLPVLPLGDAAVQVGEWVIAIGNPGFSAGSQSDYTVTAGLALPAPESFLRTDVVIEPAGSGGPMIDLRGRVVGVSSATTSPTGVHQGYGFAIPVAIARRVMEDLIQ